jgi:nitrate reductase NapE component
MMSLDIRVYVTLSVLLMFLLTMPFTADGIAIEPANSNQEMAFFMVPIYILISGLSMMLNIFVTVGLPIIIMDKIFSKLESTKRMFFATASAIVIMLIIESTLVGIYGLSVWTIKIIYTSIIYYTYYLFRARNELSPVFVILTQIVCTNLLYSGVGLIDMIK